MYYLQSRYYDPTVSRFINADTPEMVAVALSGESLCTNLYDYCTNNPIVYADPSGYLAAKVLRLVDAFSIAALFSSYMSGLYTAFSATIAKISLYVTSVLLPKIASVFWWQPWLVAGIVVAAVAIVVTAVTVYTNNQINKTLRNITIKVAKKHKGKTPNSGKSNPGALKRGMSKRQQGLFQRLIEDYKSYNSMPPDYNLPWPILVELADEVKENFK